MRVMFGNHNPTRREDDEPAVTYVLVPDDYTYVVADSAADLAVEVLRETASGGGLTHLPDQEAVLAVQAAWAAESSGPPAWVDADNPEFAVLLGALFNCPVGVPDDVEARYHTNSGAPGVGV